MDCKHTNIQPHPYMHSFSRDAPGFLSPKLDSRCTHSHTNNSFLLIFNLLYMQPSLIFCRKMGTLLQHRSNTDRSGRCAHLQVLYTVYVCVSVRLCVCVDVREFGRDVPVLQCVAPTTAWGGTSIYVLLPNLILNIYHTIHLG